MPDIPDIPPEAGHYALVAQRGTDGSVKLAWATTTLKRQEMSKREVRELMFNAKDARPAPRAGSPY